MKYANLHIRSMMHVGHRTKVEWNRDIRLENAVREMLDARC